MSIGYVIAADRIRVTVQTNSAQLSLHYRASYVPRIGDIVNFNEVSGVVSGLVDSGSCRDE